MSVNQLPSKRPKCTNSSVWNRQTADLISCQQRLTFLCLQDTKHQLRKGTLLPPSAPLLSEEKASILEPWCATWNPRRWHRTVCASAHSAARSTFSRFISDDDVVPNCPRASCQLRPAVCAPRLCNPNYVHSYRASFLCHSYQMSMAPFISHLKTGSSQPPRMSYPWVGAEPEAECLAPPQISGHSPAPGPGPIPPGAEREREELADSGFLCASLGCDHQPPTILPRWLRPGLLQMTSEGQRCHRMRRVARCTQERSGISKCDSDTEL